MSSPKLTLNEGIALAWFLRTKKIEQIESADDASDYAKKIEDGRYDGDTSKLAVAKEALMKLSDEDTFERVADIHDDPWGNDVELEDIVKGYFKLYKGMKKEAETGEKVKARIMAACSKAEEKEEKEKDFPHCRTLLRDVLKDEQNYIERQLLEGQMKLLKHFYLSLYNVLDDDTKAEVIEFAAYHIAMRIFYDDSFVIGESCKYAYARSVSIFSVVETIYNYDVARVFYDIIESYSSNGEIPESIRVYFNMEL